MNEKRLRILVLLVTGLVLTGVLACDRTAREPPRPNIILISIDTLRADHLGCYGHGRPTSPNIDALAGQGTQFLQAFSQAPHTAPSHMTMMTSLYPEVHGIVNWNLHSEETDLTPRKRLDDSVPTLAEMLQGAGYTTVAFTGGANVDALLGFDQGFDLYAQRLERGKIDDALSWLRDHRGERFFLFYHDYIVHDPYLPPRPYTRKFDTGYEGSIMDAVEAILAEGDLSSSNIGEKVKLFWDSVDRDDPGDVAFLEALYDAAIRYMDEEMIRPLLEALDELGIREDTMILFTSDHGEAFNEHGNFRHEDVFRETLHVPLIIAYPDVFPKGARIEQMVRLVDLMPTILDLLGIEAEIPVQGVSLLPAVQGRDLNLPGYARHIPRPYTELKSLRTEEHTYILQTWSKVDRFRVMDELLFDRKEDPMEAENFFRPGLGEVASLKRGLLEIEKSCQRFAYSGKGSDVMPDQETLERLKALGYMK